MSDVKYYNIEQDDRYAMVLTYCPNIEEVGSAFVTSEELNNLGISAPSIHAKRVVSLKVDTIIADTQKWLTKLDLLDKISIKIDDAELIEVLRQNRHILDHYFDSENLKLRGDRIGYYKIPKPRTKTRATKTDANQCFDYVVHAIEDKYGTKFTHIPKYDKTANFFKMLKNLVSWRDVKARTTKYTYRRCEVKWYKQIWDNPQEYFR